MAVKNLLVTVFLPAGYKHDKSACLRLYGGIRFSRSAEKRRQTISFMVSTGELGPQGAQISLGRKSIAIHRVADVLRWCGAPEKYDAKAESCELRCRGTARSTDSRRQ